MDDEHARREVRQQDDKDLFGQVVDSTRDALSGAADAYREALDDVRAQLPTLDGIVGQAARMPGVPVSRAGYLAEAVGRKHPGLVAAAIDTTPARAGLSDRQIVRIAKRSLGRELRRTTLLSVASGIPGGMAAAATIPADLVQLYGHLLRAAQKLTYLYGWRDLVRLDGSEPDPATRAALTLLLGSMAGVSEADTLLGSLAARRANCTDDELRAALCTTRARDAVTATAQALSANLARRVGGHVVDKAIPVVGGIASGIVTRGDFGSMTATLHKQLRCWGA